MVFHLFVDNILPEGISNLFVVRNMTLRMFHCFKGGQNSINNNNNNNTYPGGVRSTLTTPTCREVVKCPRRFLNRVKKLLDKHLSLIISLFFFFFLPLSHESCILAIYNEYTHRLAHTQTHKRTHAHTHR